MFFGYIICDTITTVLHIKHWVQQDHLYCIYWTPCNLKKYFINKAKKERYLHRKKPRLYFNIWKKNESVQSKKGRNYFAYAWLGQVLVFQLIVYVPTALHKRGIKLTLCRTGPLRNSLAHYCCELVHHHQDRTIRNLIQVKAGELKW